MVGVFGFEHWFRWEASPYLVDHVAAGAVRNVENMVPKSSSLDIALDPVDPADLVQPEKLDDAPVVSEVEGRRMGGRFYR